MIKQISLNIDANTTLPLTITINGHTYYSQYSLATAQTSYFEMGKAVGIEMGMEEAKDNAYTDKEMTGMHQTWYDEGYASGYEAAENDIKVKLGVWE